MDNDAAAENLLAGAAVPAVVFDEEMYLRLNPDVMVAVAGGAFASGREHYERYGRLEGRPTKKPVWPARNQVIVTDNPKLQREPPNRPPCAIETIRLSHSGGLFVLGWVNDVNDRLDSVDLYFGGWSISFDGASLARSRRVDAESALGNAARHLYGFWGFVHVGRALPGGQCSAVVKLKSGVESGFVVQAETLPDRDLRKHILGFLAAATYYGNQNFEATASIGHGIGTQLISLNRTLTQQMVVNPYVKRFGANRPRYRGSLIVCLYGRAEYMFLQNAAFGAQPGMQDYEIIYVSNSPQIGERLLREARLCTHIYGIDQTVVILSGNAGYTAANNLAAAQARSDRLMFVNPDVFPKDADWVAKHGAIVSGLPAEQTALFGAPMYYDDGALMHAGLYFELETIPSFNDVKRDVTSLLRVEHYGRGAPDTTRFLGARPVPAVTGAFISIDRAWFETLKGFNEDYIFGHYEDADLCLKSIARGRLPWLHDNALWHLEGKGSSRQLQHEGGSMVNRWLFTKIWGDTVAADLLGQRPTRKAFGSTGAVAEPPAGMRRTGRRQDRP